MTVELTWQFQVRARAKSLLKAMFDKKRKIIGGGEGSEQVSKYKKDLIVTFTTSAADSSSQNCQP